MATMYQFPLKEWEVYYLDEETHERPNGAFILVYAADIVDALDAAHNMLNDITSQFTITGCVMSAGAPIRGVTGSLTFLDKTAPFPNGATVIPLDDSDEHTRYMHPDGKLYRFPFESR